MYKHVYTWYIHVCTQYVHDTYQASPFQVHILFVPTGFRGQHRDGVRSDLPLPSSAREDEDEGSPCPKDGDFFYARPDATETEEAISMFISGLECQEQSCFERLHTLQPHEYSQHKRSGFPVGTCDTAAADGRRGSNVYEVNPWLWQFGRGKPRLSSLSVEKTDYKKEAALEERNLRGAETRRRRKA